MAVTFGRTATTTLNRGVQLVVTPDFKVEPPLVPPDVTPNAVNWADAYGDTFAQTTTQTISGIDQTITLSFTFSGFGAQPKYIKNGGSAVSFTSGTTINIDNNDTLAFSIDVGFASITITNITDNNQTLDSVILDGTMGGE